MHAEVIIILKRRIIIDKIMVAQMVGVDDMGLCFSTCESKSIDIGQMNYCRCMTSKT